MMLRRLYTLALRAHPAPFRQRFGNEMLDIFDQSPGRERAALLVDGAVSALRQWTLRSEFRRAAEVDTPLPGASGDLVFQFVDTHGPRPRTVVQGGLIALVTLCAMVMAIGVGGKARAYFIGAIGSRPGLLPVATRSASDTGLSTTVQMARKPPHPLSAIARPYFGMIRVLRTLDADGDLVLSPWEIVTAPPALRRLDTDHDGALSPEECGFFTGGAGAPAEARMAFMAGNPALAALDGNHDARISAGEIAAGASALRQLDRNADGFLTPDELLPDDESVEVATVLAGASQASAAERDRLAAEVHRRHESNRQLDRARRKAGVR